MGHLVAVGPAGVAGVRSPPFAARGLAASPPAAPGVAPWHPPAPPRPTAMLEKEASGAPIIY